MKNLLVFVLILIVLTPVFGKEAEGGLKDLYEKGLKYRKEGQWQKALEVWSQDLSSPGIQAAINPQVAFALIELATEKEAKKYYATASEMYFLGIAPENWQTNKKVLTEEVERVMPLLRENEAKRWRKKLDVSDQSILQELKRMWTEMDPVQSTALNERLLEHWERIAHARQNFKKGENTVYKTDDRGVIYVKYGSPDRTQRVTLGTNQGELINWAQMADFGEDQFSLRRDRRNYQNLKAGMELYTTYPECEIWLYSSLGTSQPVIFIFGPEQGKGAFKMLNGVEDLIPKSAFSKSSSRSTGGLVPGGLLQLMYYSKLAPLDALFEERYQELDSRWQRALVSIERSLSLGQERRAQSIVRNSLRKELSGIRHGFQSTDEFTSARKWARPTRTEYDEVFESADLTAYVTRTLDERDKEHLIFMAFEFERIFRRNQSFKFPSYDFHHQLLVRDKSMNIMAEHKGEIKHRFTNTVVYDIAHDPREYLYTVSLETFLKDSTVADRPLSVSNRFFQAPPALETDPNRLEVSDLVLGIDIPKSLQETELPFPIIPSSRILKRNILRVYIELYHLALDKNGLGGYGLDFSVIRLEKQDDASFKRKEVISTSFDFDTTSSRSVENLGIDISRLTEGVYEMSVEIRDKISLQKKQRQQSFQIVARE
ncbi:MAG: GWxTD domain-containing protein [bacterium]